MQNMMCAMRIVVNPRKKLRLMKSVSSDAPRTISGSPSGGKKGNRRAAAPEPVTHERKRDQRAQGSGDDARDERDLDREHHGVGETRHPVPIAPVVEREAPPRGCSGRRGC